MTSRFQGSGRLKEGGYLAVHRQDFKAHTTGDDWRHTADQTDMNPALSSAALNAPTVQGTLEKMALKLAGQGGFVSIGDGYDLGDYNVDIGTSLHEAFASAFTNPRLQNGGIILVKAGTYRLTQTVTLPLGITVMGEPAGTHIIGSTNEQPMFYIRQSEDVFLQGTYSATDYYAADAVDKNGFFNIILSDNIDGYALDGFGLPLATMSTVPMIQCEYGSYLHCDKVTFLGRISDTSPPLTMTRRAIGYDPLTSAPNKSTVLKCFDCYFDGMANAILFDPVNGSRDSLIVSKCRAKTGALSIADAKLYSFVAFNLCNAHFEGNYHVGDVSLGAKACFYLTSTAVVNPDVRVNIIGNSGGLTSENSNELNNFLKNDNTNTFSGALTGNSWGLAYNNTWYIVVGDGTNSIGDINGTGAIDLALGRSVVGVSDTDQRNTTVIVGYGNYTVTDTTLGGFASYVNLYGLDRNGALPTLTLNAGSDTDSASNPTIKFGPNIENISFAATSAYHTITPTYSTGSRDASSRIRNCRFEDVGIFYPSITRVGSDKISIELDTCTFNQTGTYADNFDFLITPSANNITLRNVYRTGNGYVGGIGQVAGIGYSPTVSNECIIDIDSCIWTLSDGAGSSVTNGITAASPLTGYNHFFFVTHTAADLHINNSRINCTADAHTSPTAIIGGGLPAAGTFVNFMRFEIYRLFMANSAVSGPDQRHTTGGVDYCMPAMWVRHNIYLSINNSHIRGACALQVATSLSGGGINLIGSTFSGHGTNSTVGVDFDIYPGVAPSILIDGCLITSACITNAPVLHTNVTGPEYAVLAALQIYAEGGSVKISNSDIRGLLGTNLPTGIVGLSALYADTLVTGTEPDLTNANVTVVGNQIKFENDLSTGSVLHQSFGAFVTGRKINVNNNSLRYITAGVGGSNFRGYASFNTDGYGVISGNIFERDGDLNLAGVGLGGVGAGLFSDNVFTDPTLDGAIYSTLILDASSGYGWVYERNINQTAEATIFGICGSHSVDGAGIGYTGTDHDITFGSGDGHVRANAQASAASVSCYWHVDLFSVLPPNTYVYSASMPVDYNVTGGGAFRGTDRVRLTIQNESSNDTSNDVTLSGGGSGTASVVAVLPFDYRVNNVQKPKLIADALVGNSSTGTVWATLGPITVTYRW
jgi:hypothetical protein